MLGIWYLQQLFLSFLYPFFRTKPHIASSILMHWFLAHESNNACVKKLLLVKKPVKHKKSGSHKHWFLIHDAMQLLLCREEVFCVCVLCNINGPYSLYNQEFFCAFLCICKGIFVYWILAMQIRLGSSKRWYIYLLYADHRLLTTKPFDKNRRIHHLPLEPLYILAGGAMHDLMSPYRH